MNTLLSVNTYNPTYTGKCPQIVDGEWICRTINKTFTNISVSRHKPIFEKIMSKFFNWENKGKYPLDLEDIYATLCKMNLTKQDRKHLSWTERFKLKIFTAFLPANMKKTIKHLSFIKKILEDFGNARKICYNMFDNKISFSALYLLQQYKYGNCFEHAILTKLALRLNGIKNAEVVEIKDIFKNKVHAVCVFNRDGKKFKNFENNNTIIIDTWINKADFANNMFNLYRNQYSNQFILPENKDIEFNIRKTGGITRKQIKLLKKKYSMLIFRSNNRKFMHNSGTKNP